MTLSKELMDRFMGQLGSPFPGAKAFAAKELGDFRVRDAVLPLTGLLADECSLVRWKAAEALGKIADVRATYWLVRLFSDGFPEVRCHADMALTEILRKSDDLPELKEFEFALANAIGDMRGVTPEADMAKITSKVFELQTAARKKMARLCRTPKQLRKNCPALQNKRLKRPL